MTKIVPNYSAAIQATLGTPVVLRIKVGEDGKIFLDKDPQGTPIKFAYIEQSSGSPEYDELVKTMIEQWEFEPATRRGIKVAAVVKITVTIDDSKKNSRQQQE